MKTTLYKAFNETLTQFSLHDRLQVMLIKKPGFSKTYVTLSTPFGAVNRAYQNAEGEQCSIPAGAAHFLEHKIFEKNGEDISKYFTLEEAQINAYTEHYRTTYLFSATNHIENHLVRLIEMFFFPEFTEQGIEKEKGIIKEELNMHLDDPYYIQYQTMLKQLFKSHPIQEDILGTKESIEAMTLQTLKEIHQTFYQPELSLLIIIGDLEAGPLKEHLEAHIKLPKASKLKAIEALYNEPAEAIESKKVIPLDVLMPSLLFGFKILKNPLDSQKEKFKQHLTWSLLLDLLFGKTSDRHEQWLDQGLINDTYGLDLQYDDNYGYALIGSETHHPEKFSLALNTVITLLKKEPIEKSNFERLKKQMLGGFVMSLDSLEYLAHEASKLSHQGLLVYDVLDIAKSISYADVEALKQTISVSQTAVNIIIPKNSSSD